MLGAALPVESGFIANFAWRDVQVFRATKALRWSQPGCSERVKVRGSRGLSVKVRCCGVGGGQGWLTASQQLEIEETRRIVVEQPTAHSARKQLEQEVAARSKLESAYQRQHKAAVDACVLLAETDGKVKEQKTRVQQASVQAALETSREASAHHAGCVEGRRGGMGEDVATLLSLLAAAIRKVQQQCYLLSGTRNQDLESLLVTLGKLHSFFPGDTGPRNASCASIATCGIAERSSSFYPNYHSRFPRCGRGQGGCGGIEFWCS